MPSEKAERIIDLRIDFSKSRKIYEKVLKEGVNVIPVVVQDNESKEILILAYVNEEALKYSLTHRVATFWSTSRNELWVKGATSGSMLDLVEVRVNCEQNSLLFLVSPKNNCGACHAKDDGGSFYKSCYYRKLKNNNLEVVR